MPNLSALPSHDADGALRVVIETPARSEIKITYDPAAEIFVFGRPLILGVVYPYDWGFVPSTLAPDGDPLDAMVYHQGATYPGVVISCRPVGVIRLTQKSSERRGRERNDRVIAVPRDDKRCRDARDLNRRTRLELERFFLAAVTMEDKDARIEGWAGAGAAKKLIAAAQRAFRR